MSNDVRLSNSILYIIPQDEETRTDILNIDQNTKEDVRRLHRLYISHNWQCNTIANAVIENMIRTIFMDLKNTRNGNTAFSFYNLIEAYVTVKRDEDAEKEGNINIAFRTGPLVDKIIADDTPREDREFTFITPEARYGANDKDPLTAKMLLLDKVTRKDLGDRYGILLPEPWMAVAIAVVFIENLFRELVMKIALTNKPSASINFNDNIEFHAIVKKDGLTMSMRPGMNAKLLIKSDELTEADDDEEDDE